MKCVNFVNQVFFIFTPGNLLVNKTDYKPYAFVGPTVTGPVQDPLAVTHLNNRICLRKR